MFKKSSEYLIYRIIIFLIFIIISIYFVSAQQQQSCNVVWGTEGSSSISQEPNQCPIEEGSKCGGIHIGLKGNCSLGQVCDSSCQCSWVDKDLDGYSIDKEPKDCDDNDPKIYPGAKEICDNRDNDCSGIKELNLTAATNIEGLNFSWVDLATCLGTDYTSNLRYSVNMVASKIKLNWWHCDCKPDNNNAGGALFEDVVVETDSGTLKFCAPGECQGIQGSNPSLRFCAGLSCTNRYFEKELDLQGVKLVKSISISKIRHKNSGAAVSVYKANITSLNITYTRDQLIILNRNIDEGDVCKKNVWICKTDAINQGTSSRDQSCPGGLWGFNTTVTKRASAIYLPRIEDLGLRKFFTFICDVNTDPYTGCYRFTNGNFTVCQQYETNCTNGLDDDCNGKIDGQDSQCNCVSDSNCTLNNQCSIRICNQTSHQCNAPISVNDGSICTGPDSCKNYTCSAGACSGTLLPNCTISQCTLGQKRQCFTSPEDTTCSYHETCTNITNQTIWDNNCVKDNPSCSASNFCVNGTIRSCPRQYGICASSIQACTNNLWPGCNYNNIANYSLTETCGDRLDNNCDGSIDETCSCSQNDTILCGSNVGECRTGTQICVNGTFNRCNSTQLSSPELCDSKDNNCNGAVDEDCSCSSLETRSCLENSCGTGTQTCSNTTGINLTWGSCVGGRIPTTERCDNIDNNCDGSIDEGCSCSGSYTRDCGSSTGVCTKGVQQCLNGKLTVCLGGILPSPEICNNNRDDNCNGATDENCPCSGVTSRPCDKQEGVCSGLNQTCVNNLLTTCDYSNYSSSYQSTESSCNDNKDNDCDGSIDNSDSDCSSIVQSCSDGTSYSSCSRNKPKYCVYGRLEDKSNLCGCPPSLVSRSDGTCASSETIPALRKPTEEPKGKEEPKCGNNICEEGEEGICDVDCVKKTSYVWLWATLLIVLILMLLYYGYYNYKKKGGKPGIKNYINNLLEKLKPGKKITFEFPQLFGPTISKPEDSVEAFEKLISYIKNSLEEGQSEKSIITLLVKSGWTRRDIDKAIRKARLGIRAAKR